MSEPIAWLMVGRTGHRLVFDASQVSPDIGARYTASGWSVTPLVAAPPENGRPTWKEVRAVLKDGMVALDRSTLAWQRMNSLLSRIPKEEP